MLWWVPEVLAAVNVFRWWYRVFLEEPLVEWEEWAITEFDCLSITTVLVWASRSFDHAALLALWLWGLATGCSSGDCCSSSSAIRLSVGRTAASVPCTLESIAFGE